MFYSQFILAKKGPLGTIWIAAHLEGKLRKNHITDTNITTSIDSILFPEVPIALRLSGHLLLGVVRIYSRKVNYLFHDCSEALVKIKHAFHSSVVDLPPEASTVPFHSITLPETFDFDELEASFERDSSLQAILGELVDHNVSARDLITLQEQTLDGASKTSLFTLDERFSGIADPYSLLYESDEEHAHEGRHVSSKSFSGLQENGGTVLEEDVLPPLPMDNEMDLERGNIGSLQNLETAEQGVTPPGHLNRQDPFAEVALPDFLNPVSIAEGGNAASMSISASHSMQDFPDIEKLRSAPGETELEPLFMELEEEVALNNSVSERPMVNESVVDDIGIHLIEATPVLDETPLLSRPSPSTVEAFGNYTGNDLLGTILGGRTPALKIASSPREVPELAQQKQGRKKRKAVFDDKLFLSNLLMKKQLADTTELRRKRRKIPLTEFELWRLQDSYCDQKFDRPSLTGLSAAIKELYSHVRKLSNTKLVSNLTSHKEVVNTETNEDGIDRSTMVDIDVSLAAVNAWGGVDAPLSSTPENALQTPANVHAQSVNLPSVGVDNTTDIGDDFQPFKGGAVDLKAPNHSLVKANCIDRPEVETRYFHTDSNIQEEKRVVQETEEGTEMQEPCDTLHGALDYEVAREFCDKSYDNTSPEDLAIAGSNYAVDVAVMPSYSPSLRASAEQMSEKFIFLKDTRDNGLLSPDVDANEDHFFEEADVSYLKKGKPTQNKNGWSVRTKAVANYLKSVFEKVETTSGPQPVQVSLDDLLKGRTRKEAARMYFETLVLKSRDYIHVEQSTGFADIMLSATHLLRKEVL